MFVFIFNDLRCVMLGASILRLNLFMMEHTLLVSLSFPLSYASGEYGFTLLNDTLGVVFFIKNLFSSALLLSSLSLK